MTRRLAKTFLVFGVALFHTFVVFNNLTDYDTNYQFVRHTLMMDSTFPGNHDMWRAINQPTNQPSTHSSTYRLSRGNLWR